MHRFAYYVVPTFLLVYIIRKYRESKWGKCTNNVNLMGKVALITGANSGIGFEIAKELAARNAQVILACRSLEKAQQAAEKLSKTLVNSPKLVPMELDLASLKSVKTFAELIRKNVSQIDILINNAGVAFPRQERLKTSDGFEIHFGTNHLGHFYLTNLLEDLIARAQGRIIIVASSLYLKGRLDLKGIENFDFPSDENLYANSKLANMYFAQELAKRTKDKGIKVYAVCPGWVYTGLFRHSFKWHYYIWIFPIAFAFMRTPKQGAQTPVYCATEPSLQNETGQLYKDCKRSVVKAIFYDRLAIELWDQSQRMVDGVMKTEQHK